MGRDSAGHGHRRAERSRAELWTWPTAAGAAAVLVAVLLSETRPWDGTVVAEVLWPGDVDAAVSLLQAVATASITALTMTFSVTVVALQLASQQFSPRLLRDFVRDRTVKLLLSVLVATFLFSVVVLRRMAGDAPVPSAALAVTLVLAAASAAAVVGYITHMARRLRVDTMMLVVHDETGVAIGAFYPEHGDSGPQSPDHLGLRLEEGACVTGATSGFVRAVDVAGMVAVAREHDAVVRLEARPGDHLVAGTPLATVWWRDGRRCADDAVPDSLRDGVRAAVETGYERTIEQDAAFGFRQLTDIAVKAISPAVNDPVTAAHAVGHVADLLVRLTGRRLGPTLHLDDEGVGRAVVQDRDMRYYLDLVCGPVRRFGAQEPTVLVALLRMLRDVACHAREEEHRVEVLRQVDLVLELLPDHAEVDRRTLTDMAGRVRLALAGRVPEAYLDRSGETRSI